MGDHRVCGVLLSDFATVGRCRGVVERRPGAGWIPAYAGSSLDEDAREASRWRIPADAGPRLGDRRVAFATGWVIPSRERNGSGHYAWSSWSRPISALPHPAHAGMSCPAMVRAPPRRAYPRACGAEKSRGVCAIRIRAAHPRVCEATRTRQRSCLFALWPISTHVEWTAPHREPLAIRPAHPRACGA